MDSLHTGSNELVYIRTDTVSVTIKGNAAHPNFQGAGYEEKDSTFKVSCDEAYKLDLKGCESADSLYTSANSVHFGLYTIAPIFYEQQRYEIVIEVAEGHSAAFWHDNIHIRSKVSRVGRNSQILSGVINFGNEIGLSDLIIKVDGQNYLRIVIEVFPTKISYKEDYKNIIDDVTSEIYNIAFDFLKKTYFGYAQSDRLNSSPVEFFAVINRIYEKFIKALDMILSKPHHTLKSHHTVLPHYKIKKIDN